MVITDLAQFGKAQLRELGELLVAYGNSQYEHPYFCQRGVHGCYNSTSGLVFLSDEDYNVLMLNDETLEGWYNTPYSGEEGFFEDLLVCYDEDWHEDDK